MFGAYQTSFARPGRAPDAATLQARAVDENGRITRFDFDLRFKSTEKPLPHQLASGLSSILRLDDRAAAVQRGHSGFHLPGTIGSLALAIFMRFAT